MSPDRPDGYIDPTEMAHPASNQRMADGDAVAAPDEAAQPASTDEQAAKRAEKIRSHASSHHTAGTVTPDT